MLSPQLATLAAAPDSTVTTVDTFARHAEAWPITVGFFTLIALLGAFFYWLLFKFYPSWQAEQQATRAQRESEGEKTRTHIQSLLTEKDKVAAILISDERAASKQRHSEIVDQVSGKVVLVESKLDRLSDKHEQLHAKVEKASASIERVAAKIGVSSIIALALVGAATSFVISVKPLQRALTQTIGKGRYPVMVPVHTAYRPALDSALLVVVKDEPKRDEIALKCDPKCSTGWYCDPKTGTCKEEKKDTAKKQPDKTASTPSGAVDSASTPSAGQEVLRRPDGGHSAERFASFASYAHAICSRQEGCL